MPLYSWLLLAALRASSYAQDAHNFNQWFGYWGDHQIGQSRFAVHFDAHLRRADFFRQRQQFVLRPGVDFQWTPNLQLQSAIGWLPIYRFGAAPSAPQTEIRWWQQATYTKPLRRLAWSSRTRFEHRWLSPRYLDGVTGPAFRIFEQRLRHALRVTVPFKLGWTWSAGSEVFFPVKPESHPAFMDQHRTVASIGQRWSPALRVEYYYMHQVIWQRNGRIREHDHTVGIAFFNTAPLWNVFRPKR